MQSKMKVEQILQNLNSHHELIKQKNSKSFEQFFHDFEVLEVKVKNEIYSIENGKPTKV